MSSQGLRFLPRPDFTYTSVIVTLFLVFAVSRVWKVRKGLQAVGYMPGLRPPFYPLDVPGAVIPTSWWNTGADLHWVRRRELYRGSSTVSIVPFLFGNTGIYTNDIDIARQVVIGGHRTSFIKPEQMSQALLLWGMNIIAADGEVWRKHRRVLGPAFNTNLYRLVWNQTMKTYHEMILVEGWSNKNRVEVPVVQTLVFKLALLIIGTCGFGFSFNWSEPLTSPNGDMSVQQSLQIVTETYLYEIMFPKWAAHLPITKLQQSRNAFRTLMSFIREQIQYRKAEIHSQTRPKDDVSKDNAFNLLVQANEAESTKLKLDDDELIGNIFGLLFAGHETSAHTLSATLGFLSIYEDIQEEIYKEIVSVIGHDREPTFEEYSKFPEVLAVFFEALRLIPPGHIMIREATEDTVIQIPNPPGQEGTTPLMIAKGVQVVIDMIGVQYNPRYFEDPEEFRPSRWHDISSDSEAVSAFSIGARACLGRKFAITEAVCFLSLLLRDWQVRPMLQPGESKAAWRERVLDAKIVVTLGVKDVPLVFTARK